MKEIYEQLFVLLKKCQEERESFVMPIFEGLELIEEDNEPKGANLYDKTFTLKAGKETIIVNDVSKDMCRAFQINPDKNIVSIKYLFNDKIQKENGFTWDDKY